MIATAIRKARRPIVLSLSPGPTNLSHAAEVAEYSEMWRIADDIWDGWDFPGQQFPNGILSAFDNLAKWARFAKPGNWPDADMLPWGSLTPHPGWGSPRLSRITQDEERTQFTLWAVSRSPLILGTNLTKLDDFTGLLLTNREVIAIDQTAVTSAEIPGDPADSARLRVRSVTTGGAAARLPGGRGAPADRGPARGGQDHARLRPGTFDRLLVLEDPVHERPAPLGCHRGGNLRRVDEGVRVQARARLREHRARGRDQPCSAEDAVRASRGHGPRKGHGRRKRARGGRAIHGVRDPEPGGLRGDVSPSREPDGPVPDADEDGLPAARGRDRDPADLEERV